MEKFLEMFVEDITNRVVAKLEANNSQMINTFKHKVKAEYIEDLSYEHVAGLDDYILAIAEEVAENTLKTASFSVDVSV
jgi:ATP-dependent 26S proteasome regulatory subunit